MNSNIGINNGILFNHDDDDNSTTVRTLRVVNPDSISIWTQSDTSTRRYGLDLCRVDARLCRFADGWIDTDVEADRWTMKSSSSSALLFARSGESDTSEFRWRAAMGALVWWADEVERGSREPAANSDVISRQDRSRQPDREARCPLKKFLLQQCDRGEWIPRSMRMEGQG